MSERKKPKLPSGSGDFVMPYGKYHGECLSVIWHADRDYLEWMAKNTSSEDVKEAIEAFLKER